MIPQQNIVAWSKVAPWAEPRQVEQDLIIARAIVQLFGDPFLRGELRFRGGTALNKLHFPKALRYRRISISRDERWRIETNLGRRSRSARSVAG